MKRLLAVLTALVLAVGLSAPALANTGSDGPTPYTVGLDGITLPTGDTFKASGHVNIRTTDGESPGIHFDPNNGHPGGQWIGENFIPWSAFGIESTDMCVEWVQISHYNQHFGEGGQKPAGKACDTAPDPLSGQDETVESVCTEPANGTLTTKTTTTAWTQEYVHVNGEWALGVKVFAEPEATTKVTQDDNCIPVKPEPESGTESGTYDYCTAPADGTRTHVMTETAWTQDWSWSQEAGEWVLGAKVFGKTAESALLTQDVECAAPEVPVTPEPTPDPEPTPVTPEEPEDPATPEKPDTPKEPETPDTPTTLATTGVDTTGVVAIAILMLVIGTAIALYSRRSK